MAMTEINVHMWWLWIQPVMKGMIAL